MKLICLFLIAACSYAGEIKPEQIHLSWTENTNQMRVTWVTYIHYSAQAAFRPILCGGVPSPSEFTTIKASTTKFLESKTGEDKYQYISTAVFDDLKPQCWYEYKVANWNAWSDTYIFSGRTPDTDETYNDVNNPLTMVIFGDWGTGDLGQYTKHLLGEETIARDYAGIIHMGDMAYNLDSENGQVGDEYLRMIEPISATIPYMTAPGNHEGYNNYTHYKARFNMPYNEANNGTSYFYSFNLGAVHFVVYNSNAYFHSTPISICEADTQNNWLIQDLAEANANRDVRPWIIALAHHPLYCSQDWFESGSQNDCGKEPSILKPYVEDIFYKNGVDIVFQAHVHNYERDAAIYQNKTILSDYDDLHTHINANAPVFITSGNAGNVLGHNDPASTTPQPWARFLSNDYGYGRLNVFNKTHLYWEQFSSQALTEIDYVWIIKNRTRYDPVLLNNFETVSFK